MLLFILKLYKYIHCNEYIHLKNKYNSMILWTYRDYNNETNVDFTNFIIHYPDNKFVL